MMFKRSNFQVRKRPRLLNFLEFLARILRSRIRCFFEDHACQMILRSGRLLSLDPTASCRGRWTRFRKVPARFYHLLVYRRQRSFPRDGLVFFRKLSGLHSCNTSKSKSLHEIKNAFRFNRREICHLILTPLWSYLCHQHSQT